MHVSKRISMILGGALLAAGAIYANGQVAAIPMNPPVNMGSANVCSSGLTSPAPCTQTATVTFQFTKGGTIAAPKTLTQGVAGLDFSDATTGTCTTNGVHHVYVHTDTCTVDVVFAPLHPGPRYGAVVLTDNTARIIATALVHGTGNGPQVVFTSNNAPKKIAWDYGRDVVTVDAGGNVFLASFDGHDLRKLAAGNYSLHVIAGGLPGPNGIAVDGAGNVFLALCGPTAIYELTVAAQGYGPMIRRGSGLNCPGGLTVDGSGNIFVADTGNGVVKEILAQGGYATIETLGSGFTSPSGVALDASANAFIADGTEVKEILAGDGYSTVTTLPGSFSHLSDLVVDAGGNLFVVDSDNNAVMKILAADGYKNATTIQSGVARPWGVAVDASGNVFVSDGDSYAIVSKISSGDPPNLKFATTAPGKTSTDSPKTVTIANYGNDELNTSYLRYPKDFPEAAGESTDCTNSTPLAVGDSCTLTVKFSPLFSSLNGSSTLLEETVGIAGSHVNRAAPPLPVSGTVQFPAPAITSPAPGFALPGSTVTFNWSAGTGPTAYQLKVGTTGAGSSDVYLGSSTSALSALVSGIPINGQPLYVTLDYKVNGIWHPINYTYPEAVIPPELLTPVPGSTLADSGVTFTWSAGTGATAYHLKVGTTGPGSSDVYLGGSTTSLSAPVSGIPSNGVTLYVTLAYKLSAGWQAISRSYTEPGSPIPPAISSPSPGSTLSGSSVTFNWSAGAGPTAYQLKVGTTGAGSSDIYLGASTTSLSALVSGIPPNGATLYVTLGYKVSSTWHTVRYTYSETPTPPAITTPQPGSTLLGSDVTFTWSAGGGPTAYQLKVGTTGVGSSDVYLGGSTTSLSVPVSSIPTNGQPVYVRLNYRVNNVWHGIDYTYTAQ